MNSKIIISDAIPDFTYDIKTINNELIFYIYEFDSSKSFEEYITDTTSIRKDLYYNRELANMLNRSKDVKYYSKVLNDNTIDEIKNINNVEFVIDYKKSVDYINSNEILQSKNVIINLPGTITKDDIDYIKNNLNYKSNILFKIDENDKLITYIELIDTFNKLNNMLDPNIISGLSKMELIMYIYDKVKSRVYHMETSDDMCVSRDLTSTLNGNDIVCEGFVNIFESLLNQVGIKSDKIIYMPVNRNNHGHIRLRIYVDDPKYGINGVYYFDPTYDSKKDNLDNNYIYNYKYFGLLRKNLDDIDKGMFIDEDIQIYPENVLSMYESEVKEKGFDNISNIMQKIINNMNKAIDGSILYLNNFAARYNADNKIQLDESHVSALVSRDYKLFESDITPDKLLNILYNVRKVEHEEYPELYKLSLQDLYSAFIKSDWHKKDPSYNFIISNLNLYTDQNEKNHEFSIMFSNVFYKLINRFLTPKEIDELENQENKTRVRKNNK